MPSSNTYSAPWFLRFFKLVKINSGHKQINEEIQTTQKCQQLVKYCHYYTVTVTPNSYKIIYSCLIVTHGCFNVSELNKTLFTCQILV
jgi:hypothetical protein